MSHDSGTDHVRTSGQYDLLLCYLPHPLHNSEYFASKTNFLNVYFIKKAWSSAVILFSWVHEFAECEDEGEVVGLDRFLAGDHQLVLTCHNK